MTKEELRIGNFIWRPCCNDKVVEIRENGIIGSDSMRGVIPFSEIEPIQLTEELLVKNGFELIKRAKIKGGLGTQDVRHLELYGIPIYQICVQNISLSDVENGFEKWLNGL